MAVTQTTTAEDVNDFMSWNPSLSYNASNSADCQLKQGYQYCAQSTLPTATTTSLVSKTSTQQATSMGLSGEQTPLPIQTGMTSKCGKFYLVKSGDGCYDIALANKITLSDFYSWNPALNGDCSGLYSDYYACVGLLSGATASTSPATRTTATPRGLFRVVSELLHLFGAGGQMN
ncbi:Uncharacterized protein TPAR_07876 [Tolypocladium paradoxum]|uniref:LysM domain-containing protein n=1 Tax=Tolypocladium paradoxum TaxID=94208 RepID=A0A2S4KP37_9HYPO|nr:Uncharacterized protein TPAR_07876 [Tolypocladium paradoxum]